MARLEAVFPIGGEDPNALPVKDPGVASSFYQNVLGFSVLSADGPAVTLGRDGVKIGLVRDPAHDPGTAGSCYFEVDDLDAVRDELEGRGARPGAVRTDRHDGEIYRVFFVREDEDGYCFCFGKKVS